MLFYDTRFVKWICPGAVPERWSEYGKGLERTVIDYERTIVAKRQDPGRISTESFVVFGELRCKFELYVPPRARIYNVVL
jgi:hypothetical protein